ncbi:MAG: ABC transporter permease [Chitinophagales bacterium]
MKQLLIFIRKEFYHVFRDRRTLLIMFGLPIAQILLFGFALSSEVKNLKIAFSDQARDVNSGEIINKIKESAYFIVEEKPIGYNEIESTLKKGNIKAVVVFPPDFGRDLQRNHKAQVQIIADGTDPNTAKTLVNYLNAIIAGYQMQISPAAATPYTILPETRMLYNEEGNGSLNFIPGVLALVLMIVCTALTSVAVVREKELGTMEVLLVSPYKPVMVLIAKAIPYLILSLVNFILILLLSVYVLNVPILGNIILLFLESMLFILACLSFGLFISTVTESQQAALLLSMMGMMIPTMVFTGFIFPLENMPWIFQLISNIVPSRWYYLIVKSVMLKGLGFEYVWKETLILTGMTVILLAISLKNFKRRLA